MGFWPIFWAFDKNSLKSEFHFIERNSVIFYPTDIVGQPAFSIKYPISIH
jgi:hypothetical protein